jgi:hypothetical protein
MKTGGIMLLVGVGFLLCVVGVSLYLTKENNDYKRVMNELQATRADYSNMLKLTEVFRVEVATLREAFDTFTKTLEKGSELNLKQFSTLGEELRILKVQQYGVDKRIAGATRNVSIEFKAPSIPIPVSIIDTPRSRIDEINRELKASHLLGAPYSPKKNLGKKKPQEARP